jgi:succinyl-diaminopimelate desuccinylase
MIKNNHLIELTSKLIEFNSITPNDDGAIEYIKTILKQYNFNIIDINREDTKNIFAYLGDLTKPIISFAGHIDVVPSGDVSDWSYNPFQLTETNNYLYGRGIADMKGAIACFLAIIPEIIKHQLLTNFCIALILTSDEEGNARNGTVKIVEYLQQHNIRIKYCIIGEPSSKNQIGDVIKIGRRGSLTAELEIIGKQGHVAYPHLADNPIHLFSKVLSELCKIQWDQGDDYFPSTSFQITNINSGLGVDNVIPNSLIIRFNFRYNNTWSAEQLQQKIIEIIDNNNLKYKIKWYNNAKPFISKVANLVAITKLSIKDTTGVDTELTTDGGTSDGRFLINVCDELIEFGLNNSTIHQIDERIKSDELFLLSKIYLKILNKILDE